MKKIKLNKGLNLNKESITKLQESQMFHLKGGIMGENSTSGSCGVISCQRSCNEVACAVD
jgi:hypothetical protein